MSTKASKYTARVSEKYYLGESEKFLLTKLELTSPDKLEFEAGQYVSIKVNERGERRSYSMVSTPDITHGVTLVAEMIEGGLGSGYWKQVKIGDTLELLGPLGRFTLVHNPPAHDNLLFVATGAGITPIKCMIEDLLLNKHESRPMRLVWGMRSERDIFWFDNFDRLSAEHPNFVFDPVLSQPSETWALCQGHVQDCLRRDFTKGELKDWEAYVCGNPKTVESIEECLTLLGMEISQVHHEKFS